MPTVTSVIKFFPSAKEGFTTTTASSTASGAATVQLNSVSGYSNGDIVALVIEPTSSSAKQVFTGVVDTAGVQITGVVWTEGTNQTHSAGVTVVDYWTATHMSMVTKGLLVQHSQTGTHTGITSTSLANTGTLTQVGTTTVAGLWDGWVGANESWAFASSTTITVPTDATLKYGIGDYLKITQSATVKYFVITAVTATVLTVSGLTGSTVANSAITLNYYSKTRTPLGAGSTGLPYNPYKFRASRNAAANSGNGAFAALAFDTEQYDTNNNLLAGVYTVPVNGFYQFNWHAMGLTSGTELFLASLFKNGTETSDGSQVALTTQAIQSHGSDLVQCTAGDTVDVRTFQSVGRALIVGNIYNNYFSGHLVSIL